MRFAANGWATLPLQRRWLVCQESVRAKAMKPINLLAAVAALVMMATPSLAAKWIHVATGSNNTIYYFDAETFQRSGNQVTVGIKWDHSFDITSNKRETISRARFDCGKKTVYIIDQTLKYVDGTSEVLNIPTYVQDMGPIPRGTKMEATLNAVCRVSTRR
jgi:hypothetical protein